MTQTRIASSQDIFVLTQMGIEALTIFDRFAGLPPQDWNRVPDYVRESMSDEVRFILAGNTAEQLHDYRLHRDARQGNYITHSPTTGPFENLPINLKRRLTLFVDTIQATARAFDIPIGPAAPAPAAVQASSDQFTGPKAPYVGAPVEYINGYGRPMPAVITYIYGPTSSTEPADVTARELLLSNQTVDLHVFYPSYDQPVEFVEGVPFAENRPLSWRWR